MFLWFDTSAYSRNCTLVSFAYAASPTSGTTYTSIAVPEVTWSSYARTSPVFRSNVNAVQLSASRVTVVETADPPG